MTTLFRFAAVSAIAIFVSACADQPTQGTQGFATSSGSGASFAASDPAPTPTAAPNAQARSYRLFSVAGIGDIRMGRDRLTTSDGQNIAFRPVGDGVYAFTAPQTRLSNGQSFCAAKPVTHFTWHQNAVGQWIMNVGAWEQAPERPDANASQADGNCGVFTYTAV